MNIQNLKSTLAVLKRAQNLNMSTFQSVCVDPKRNEALLVASTEEELHQCGNSACIAGYMAVSKEWRDYGGLMEGDVPQLPTGESAHRAMAKFWGLSVADAESVVYGECWNSFLDKYGIDSAVPRQSYGDNGWDWTELTKEHAVSLFEQLIQHAETQEGA